LAAQGNHSLACASFQQYEHHLTGSEAGNVPSGTLPPDRA
jgi:hypothetical protein